MVDLAQELGSHHLVRAVLDETCDVQETCRETQGKRKQQSKKQTLCGTGDPAEPLLSLCLVPQLMTLSGLNATHF